MNIGEKIVFLRERYGGGNNIKFAEIMGESPTTTSNWCKAKSLGREVLVKILSKLPDVDANWLLMDTGEPFKSWVSEPKISYSAGRPYYNVDFIGGFDLVLNDQTINPEYYIDFQPYNKDGVMWCNITGHSMEPEISSGDMIAIKEVPDWDKYINMGETYAIVTKNDLRTVKRVNKGSDADHWLLVPVNEKYDSQEIAKEMISRVFIVIGCMKRL